MRVCLAPFVLSLGLLPGIAWGQATAPQRAEAPPAASSKTDAAKEADIRRLLGLMGGAKMMSEMRAQMSERMKATIGKIAPTSERSQKVTDAFLRKFDARFKSQDFIDLLVPIYDKHFTDEDIQGMIQFYESPLGQKTVKAMPEITQETFSAVVAQVQKILPDIMREMQEEFPELKQEEKPGSENR